MKPKTKTRALLVLCITALFSITLNAQEAASSGGAPTKGRFSRFSVGISLGHLKASTDISQYNFFPVTFISDKRQRENRFGGGLHAGVALTNLYTVRGQLLFGSLAGVSRRWTDTLDGRSYKSIDHAEKLKVPKSRLKINPNNTYFRTNIFETSLQVIFNVSNLDFSPSKIRKPRKIGLYAFVGQGLVWYDAKSYHLEGGPLVKDKPYTKQDTGVSGKTTESVSSAGVGLKYKLNKNFDLAFEPTVRRVWNDKLDGWVRGDGYDYYVYTSFALTYKIGAQNADEALEWINPLEVMYNDIQETKAKVAGLTNDKDADGVADIMDKDGSTPEGVKVYGDGTSVDQDRDGVADSKDADPNSAIGAKVDENGKEMDSDGDGVADGLDQEGNTAKGSLVDVNGRGIEIKNMPGGASMVSGGGGGTAVYFPSVWFEMGSASVGSVSYDKLATIARALKANSSVKVTVTGHASKEGTDVNNMKLGQKRAQAVADHLMKNYGIGSDRIVVVESKGETEPLSDKISAVNRRVDINVK